MYKFAMELWIALISRTSVCVLMKDQKFVTLFVEWVDLIAVRKVTDLIAVQKVKEIKYISMLNY